MSIKGLGTLRIFKKSIFFFAFSENISIQKYCGKISLKLEHNFQCYRAITEGFSVADFKQVDSCAYCNRSLRDYNGLSSTYVYLKLSFVNIRNIAVLRSVYRRTQSCTHVVFTSYRAVVVVI